MKKIFRMALVCALAGATLLYTGCTKDYSDDINDLKDRVSTVETTVSQLQAAINAGSVITNVTANTDGYLVTLSNGLSYQVYNGKDGAKGDKGDKGDAGTNGTNGTNGENGKDGSVVTIGENGNWFIDDKDTGVKAKATVSEITINEDGYICIDGKATDVKAGTVAVWDATKGTVTFKGINADGSDLVIGVCELESIVFIPQVYMEGIEGAKYNYITGSYYYPYTLDAKTLADYSASYTVKDDEGATAVAVAGYVHEIVPYFYEDKNGVWNPYKDGKKYSWYGYEVGEIAEAEYHVNPNSFDLSKANFTLEGMDVETITRADETIWKPVLKSIARNEDKNATVKYQIEFPKSATGMDMDAAQNWHPEESGWWEYEYDEKTLEKTDSTQYWNSDVAVMRLRGTLKDSGKAVDSDYEAIVPFRNELHHLAFTAASKYTTEFDDQMTSWYPRCYDACNLAKSDRELYITSLQAMKKAPSVNVQYQESLDIADIIEVHYHPGASNEIHTIAGGTEETMTLKELFTKYPQFSATYQLVGYTLGNNTSREDMYGQIEGSVFYPCYVKDDGKTQVRNDASKGETHGISSVGRKPIVLVTVQDENGVVLYGYFKIKICRDVVNKADFIIKDLGKYPYVCEWSKGTTWSEASHTVLENQLKMSYATFKQRYVWAADGKKAASPDGKTYIKNDKGEFVDVTPFESPYFYNAKKEAINTENFGYFVYTADAQGTGINDKFEIKISTNKQLDNIKNAFGGEITLYTKFGSADDYVYMGLTFSVDEPATCTFIEHNKTYWYQPVGETEANTVFVNPRVPTNGGEDDSWTVQEPKSMDEPAFTYGNTKSSVTGMGLNLEKEWVYNRVQFKIDDATMAAYNKLFGTATLPMKYHFEFNQHQTWGHNGDSLVVGKSIYGEANTQSLYLKKAGVKYAQDLSDLFVKANGIARLRNEIVRVYDGTESTGTRQDVVGGKSGNFNVDLIMYEHNESKDNSEAKKLLNEYSHFNQTTEGSIKESLDELLYADVDLVATYGTCDIPFGKETFHVAFFRPIDILDKDNEGLQDAIAGGDKINLFNLFTIKDWQGREIINHTPATYDKDGNEKTKEVWKFAETAMGGGDAKLKWNTFYGIDEVYVYVNEIKTDQTGTVAYLKDQGTKGTKGFIEGVNNSANVWVALASDATNAISATTDPDGRACYKVELKNADDLTKYVFYYANHNGSAKTFNFYLPVGIRHWWGVVEANVTVPVKATKGTETK